MLGLVYSVHLSCRSILPMRSRDLRTIRQRVMPYVPSPTLVKSTTGRNMGAGHAPLQCIVVFALCMARVIGNPPPPRAFLPLS